jgi:hypothetical protein
VIVSHSRRFIFVHVHKAGGTSMELALAPHLAWNDLILGSTELGQAMNGPYQRAHGLFDHSSVEEIVGVCGAELFSAYFSFALVRHPVARLASLYNFIFSHMEFARREIGVSHVALRRRVLDGEPDDARPFLDWPATRAYAETDGFGGFIRSSSARSDRAFMPQTEQLQNRDGSVTVNLAISLDDLPRRLPALGERLGLTLRLEHHNAAPFVVVRASEVCPDDRGFIRELYADDYLAFEFT